MVHSQHYAGLLKGGVSFINVYSTYRTKTCPSQLMQHRKRVLATVQMSVSHCHGKCPYKAFNLTAFAGFVLSWKKENKHNSCSIIINISWENSSFGLSRTVRLMVLVEVNIFCSGCVPMAFFPHGVHFQSKQRGCQQNNSISIKLYLYSANS